MRLLETSQFLLDKFVIRADFSLRATGRLGLSRRVSAGQVTETERRTSLRPLDLASNSTSHH